MAPFVAYADESGAHKPAEQFILAGFCGELSAWGAFEAPWNQCLEEEGIPRLHARYFFSSTRARPDPHASVQKFVDVIVGSGVVPFGISVFREPFSKLSDEWKWKISGVDQKPSWKKAFGDDPHRFGFIVSIFEVIKKIPQDSEIAFVFDDKKPLETHLLASFNQARSDLMKFQSRTIAGCTFRPSEGCGALQAADLFAYSLFRRKEEPFRKILEQLCGSHATTIPILDSVGLEVIMKAVNANEENPPADS